MDFRRKDADGLTICPQCGRHYQPVLGERDPRVPIQKQYPDADVWEREQLMTGLCSDKCFDEHIGAKGYVYTDGKRFVMTATGSKRKIFAGDDA